METIITIFTILSMYMNAAQSSDNKYYYNADIENGIVNTLYVYEKQGEGLNQYLAYDFKYDEQGRLVEKTVNKWDCTEKAYLPSLKLSTTYMNDNYELTLSYWDKQDLAWGPSIEKVIYQYDNGQLSGVSYLAREKGQEYHSVSHLHILNPDEILLFASNNR